MFDVVYLLGVTAVGEPLHSHPKNITQITPRPDLLLSEAFSVSSFTNTDLLAVCWCAETTRIVSARQMLELKSSAEINLSCYLTDLQQRPTEGEPRNNRRKPR